MSSPTVTSKNYDVVIIDKAMTNVSMDGTLKKGRKKTANIIHFILQVLSYQH